MGTQPLNLRTLYFRLGSQSRLARRPVRAIVRSIALQESIDRDSGVRCHTRTRV